MMKKPTISKSSEVSTLFFLRYVARRGLKPGNHQDGVECVPSTDWGDQLLARWTPRHPREAWPLIVPMTKFAIRTGSGTISEYQPVRLEPFSPLALWSHSPL